MSEVRFGLLSGAAWGLATALLIAGINRVWLSFFATVWMFAPVGAVVGLAVVVALRRVSLKGPVRLAAVSLVTLLWSGAAFGVVLTVLASAGSVVTGHARPELLVGVLLAPIYWLWGLVATGLVLPLWPLSVLNHWWLGRLRTRAALSNREDR